VAALVLALALAIEAGGVQTLDDVEWIVGVKGFDQANCWVFPQVPVHHRSRALFVCLDDAEARFFLAFAARHEAAPIGTHPGIPTSSFDRRRNETYWAQKGWYYQFRGGYPKLPTGVGESLIAAARGASDDATRLWIESGTIAVLGPSDGDGCAPLLLTRAATPDQGLEIECAAPSLELAKAMASLRDLWTLLGNGVRNLESWSATGRYVAENRFYPGNGTGSIPILALAAFEARLSTGQALVEIETRSAVPLPEIYRRLRIALVHRDPERLEGLRGDHYVQSAEIYLLASSHQDGGAS
jgi:hypothetical protein